MRRLIFVLLFLLGVKHIVFGQNVEKVIFQYIYNDIKKQNEYLSIKKNLKGIFLLFDPITGEQEIKYSAEIDKKVKDSFVKFSIEDQINILSTNESLMMPLKDTLIIVDTLNFFSEGDIILNQEHYQFLKIIRTKPNKTCVNYVYLYAIGIRNNILKIALANEENKYLFIYHFYLSSSKILLQKTSIIEKRISFE